MESDSSSEEQYLSVSDVARRYSIDSKTVYRLAHRGDLPAFKVGSQWRFREEKLREWEAKQGQDFY